MGPVSATQETDEHRSPVLLVEDELLLRWPAGEYLRDAGYRVIEAATATEAIAVLASGTRIDLVFSAGKRAGEMNGHARGSGLATTRPQIPLLVAWAHRQDRRRVTVGA